MESCQPVKKMKDKKTTIRKIFHNNLLQILWNWILIIIIIIINHLYAGYLQLYTWKPLCL